MAAKRRPDTQAITDSNIAVNQLPSGSLPPMKSDKYLLSVRYNYRLICQGGDAGVLSGAIMTPGSPDIIRAVVGAEVGAHR